MVTGNGKQRTCCLVADLASTKQKRKKKKSIAVKKNKTKQNLHDQYICFISLVQMMLKIVTAESLLLLLCALAATNNVQITELSFKNSLANWDATQPTREAWANREPGDVRERESCEEKKSFVFKMTFFFFFYFFVLFDFYSSWSPYFGLRFDICLVTQSAHQAAQATLL